VALVVRPDHYGPARAGFFFRERDNAIRTAESYEEFVIRPRRHGPSSMAAEPEPEPQQAAPAGADGEDGDSACPQAPPEPQSAEPERADAVKTSRWVLDDETSGMVEEEQEPELPSFAKTEPVRRWVWPIVLLALLAATGFGVERYYRSLGPPQPLSLWVADMGGQLLIEWDRTARPIRDATNGTLEITDGKDRVDIEIEGARLREGSVDYVRRSEIVDVRLRVHQRGRSTEEVIRFVGQPVRRPPTAEEADALKQNESLKAEVASLRAQLEQLQRRDARRKLSAGR
jgi:hypothetical protein